MVTRKRKMTAEDLLRFEWLEDPQISPDGNKVVYIKRTIDSSGKYISNLFIRSLVDSWEQQWTYGNHRNSHPRWSPDGNWLAFESDRSGDIQVWLLSVKGGEACQLTTNRQGAAKPVWSPNSEKLLVQVRLSPNETLHETQEQETTAPEDSPRSSLHAKTTNIPVLSSASDKDKDSNSKPDQKESIISPLPALQGKPVLQVDYIRYKSDDAGFWDGKYSQLVVCDRISGQLHQITTEEQDHSMAAWSPDGKQIVCCVIERKSERFYPTCDLWLHSVEDGSWSNLSGSTGTFMYPTWSPDGKTIACVGYERKFEQEKLMHVWHFQVDTGNRCCLTEKWDVHFSDAMVGDMRSRHVHPGAVWSADGQGNYITVSKQGRVNLHYISVTGENIPIVSGEHHVYGWTLHPMSGKAVVAISDPLTPGDLFFIDIKKGKSKRLTTSNQWLKEVELSGPEMITYQTEDGWKIQGWLLKPSFYQTGKTYPLILQVHGGPHTMYGYTFFHELHFLAAKGYAILYTNPRGSHGYGQKFVNAVRGDYGGKDYQDLMKGVTYVVTHYDYLDEQRMGVTGGSYGGFMTNWIVTQNKRFKAAVTQRSISNWISFAGVSDIGYYFAKWEIHGDLVTDPDRLWQHSPLRYAQNVETPLLILHGERDYRCPIEQAEQFFTAIKQHKKASVRLMRFPDATHELSRSGDPGHRIIRLQAIAGWFDEYV
ncbi:S9 family peptidase [Brevibacillus laterosporus]|uniref:S9 family peptidase n=1 Tax=Brevibacillus laterosporus TaxID=1465 RepID=UPI003D1B3DF2